MKRLFAIMTLWLVVGAGCHGLARTDGGDAGAGPAPPASPWAGQPIGQLVAVWGKPSRISEAEGVPGGHDYEFSYSLQARSGFPVIGPWGWGYLRPGFPYGFWGPWGWGYDYYEPVYWTCEAVVRVGPDGLVDSAKYYGGQYCGRHSPFTRTPPDGTPAETARKEGGQ
jgi:hypothetical protein